MADIEQLLVDNLLVVKKIPIDDKSGSKDKPDFDWVPRYVKCEETWKTFLDVSFDTVPLKMHFNTKTDEERAEIFKFGVSCLIHFTQANFTGPDLDKETEEFLERDMFKIMDFSKMLSVNNEEININAKYPQLLVTAKIIFEWCIVSSIINIWWYWRALYLHQHILEDLSPTLLSDADRLYKLLQVNFNLEDHSKVALDIEVAQLYLLFRQLPKAREHLASASEILGVQYKYVGILGKRTRHQENEIAQLALKVDIDENKQNANDEPPTDDKNLPKNLPLNDDEQLNNIEFIGEPQEQVALANIAQKLFLAIIQEMLVSKPQDELQSEELQPFIDLVLSQRNTYSVRVVALMLRCKLECKKRRTIERSLTQCEEIIKSFKNERPRVLTRVSDVFGSGLPPMWRAETQYADLCLNLGLIKTALDVYLKVKMWEEVIVCYTLLKMKHKATEIIKQQLEVKPTPKMWCYLGDATDDPTCYEKAWELSKRRSHRAQRHWGAYYYVRKQYKECIPHFEKSASINPLQANVWFRLGYAALQIENWTVAATAFRRHTTIEPESFEAWNNLAQAYLKIGNKRNAHQALLEALKCNYENWHVWENLLEVSCDIGHYSDVIRAYHRLLDMKEKYLHLESLSLLVHNVLNDANDIDGQPCSKHLRKTRVLLGRLVSIFPGDGFLWELNASLAPDTAVKGQRLLRAYRGYTQGDWDKNPASCQQVLQICKKLAEIGLSSEVGQSDQILHSIKLNVGSAVAAVKKHDWEDTRTLLNEVSANLEQITEKYKDIYSAENIKT